MAHTDYRWSTSIDAYWLDIERYGRPPMSRSQEVAEFALIRSGDEEARARVAESNLRFVVSIARKYDGLGLPIEDLVCCGNVGLLEAIGRFDSSRGFKFITYAVWWIRQAIKKALSENKSVLTPHSAATDYGRLERKIQREAQRRGVFVDLEEMAELEGLSNSRLEGARVAGMKDARLDSPGPSGGDMTLGDAIGVDDDFDGDLDRAAIEAVLGELPERSRLIMRAFFRFDGEPYRTLDDIGRQFGITRERVRQIKNQVVERLKHNAVLMELA